MLKNSSAQLKLPKGTKIQAQEELNTPLIPSLNDDVAKLCLASVPRHCFPLMGAVCKSWRSFIQSEELIAARKEAGKSEEWIYVLTAGAKLDEQRWQVLDRYGEARGVVPPMPGPEKAGYGVVVLDGKFLVVGGYCVDFGKECVSDFVYQYDSRLNRWSQLARMNIARCDFACAEVDGLVYAIGGHGPNGNSLSSVEVYTPEKNQWTLIESLRRPRWGCFAFSFQGEVYVMGGRSSFTIGNSRLVDVYNPKNRTWRELKNGCVMVTAHAVLNKSLFCTEWRNQRRLAVFSPDDSSWRKVLIPVNGS
uniref:F-box/kelch-repeat protein n=1 Tax=Ananas comosus var. bracteatus TaxID=296719 RepID=A0A6V7NPI2_ANACO|nr:unnamed protein product [Ananas comosus var. bracteatus]